MRYRVVGFFTIVYFSFYIPLNVKFTDCEKFYEVKLHHVVFLKLKFRFTDIQGVPSDQSLLRGSAISLVI